MDNPYRETDPLGSYDPLFRVQGWGRAGRSKLAQCVSQPDFDPFGNGAAGNVIGGGDWSEDRILPDLARAFGSRTVLRVRNRHATRPWQHVLDLIEGYLMLAEALLGPRADQFETGFNFGPEPIDQRSVGDLVDTARRYWPGNIDNATDPDAP